MRTSDKTATYYSKWLGVFAGRKYRCRRGQGRAERSIKSDDGGEDLAQPQTENDRHLRPGGARRLRIDKDGNLWCGWRSNGIQQSGPTEIGDREADPNRANRKTSMASWRSVL
jgi:hypothetical protein